MKKLLIIAFFVAAYPWWILPIARFILRFFCPVC